MWYRINYLGCKWHSGTIKTKESQAALVRVSLFWKSHCVICVPVLFIPYHVTGSCKGPIEGRSRVFIDRHLTVDASSTPDLSILPPPGWDVSPLQGIKNCSLHLLDCEQSPFSLKPGESMTVTVTAFLRAASRSRAARVFQLVLKSPRGSVQLCPIAISNNMYNSNSHGKSGLQHCPRISCSKSHSHAYLFCLLPYGFLNNRETVRV